LQYVVGPIGWHISGIANKTEEKNFQVFLDKLFPLI